MALARIDRALAPRIPAEVRVDGVTVHACLDQVGRTYDAAFLDLVFDHVPGQNWKLSDRATVLLNGTDVRKQDGLSTTVGLHDVLDVRSTRSL